MQLLGNRVLIEPVEEETACGFTIPEEYRSFRTGIVKAIGTGRRLKNGVRKPIEVAVGARVVLSNDYRMPIEHEGKQHFLITEEKILCVLENNG